MQLQDMCNGLKDENEIAIMKEYSCNAKRYTTVVTSKIIFLNFYICLLFCWTHELQKFQIKIISINNNNFSAHLYVYIASQEFIKIVIHVNI